MKRVFVVFLAVGVGAGCAQGPVETKDRMPAINASGQIRPVARPDGGGAVNPVKKPPAGARTVAQFDTTTVAEKNAAEAEAKAAQKSGDGRLLGRTVASLGDPGDPGLWIKTPLVKAPAKGRVVYPVNGKGVQLDLLPIDGPETAGSRLSLAAFRVIEAPLTELPEVDVYAQ